MTMVGELLTVSALELARRIREREVSPVEVVDAHIARIEEVNPRLNAVVAFNFEEARREAKRAEVAVQQRPRSELPPFHGVPCTIKELISVKGMPFTAGVVARKHVRGEEDAPLVARMRAAGCIVLGVTNVSEAGLWLETTNRLYGRTNNAYSPDHISGGSSGGEGAIIGAGGSPIGLGADIGGSIRNPCFFNGIAGHKPTGGLLPSIGHWPPAAGARGRYCVAGPMGRFVEDLIVLMECLSPEDDPYRDKDRGPFRRATSMSPKELRVYYFDDNGLARVDDEMAHTIDATIAALARVGFKAKRWRPSAMNRSAEIWGAKVSSTEDLSVRELLGNGVPIDLVSEWLKLPFGRSNHILVSLVMATFERVAKLTHARTEMLIRMASELRAEIEQELGDDGVLICPPYPRAAPRHVAPLLSPFAFSYCGIFNVLELPATAVPCRFNERGLPLGVQVVAKRFRDPLALWVAGCIEREFGGWRPPS